MAPDETVPRFLWRLAWGGLFAVIAIGLITLIVLAAGAADPPRAGPLVFESSTAQVIPLPDAPYTLEVTAHFGDGVDPAEVWGIDLMSNAQPQITPVAKANGLNDIKPPEGGHLQDKESEDIAYFSRLGVLQPDDLSSGEGNPHVNNIPLVSILLNGYNFFAVPPLLSDFTPFIHIGPNMESNKITLDVGKDGQSVLRLNDEIAWRGIIPHARSAIMRLSTHAILDRIALYAPESAFSTTIPH